jgi:hypothetical protein
MTELHTSESGPRWRPYPAYKDSGVPWLGLFSQDWMSGSWGYNNFLVDTVRTYLKAIAYINNPPDNLIVSTGFAVLRPMSMVNPRFLWRIVQCQQFVDSVMSHSEGVSYPAISPSCLAFLPFLLPPFDEQVAAIAGWFRSRNRQNRRPHHQNPGEHRREAQGIPHRLDFGGGNGENRCAERSFSLRRQGRKE